MDIFADCEGARNTVWGHGLSMGQRRRRGPLPAYLDERILELIFTFLDLADLRSCALVCRPWCQCLRDGGSEVWRLLCIRTLAPEALNSNLLKAATSYKAKLRAYYNSWNPNDCSRNIYIKSNGFTLHRYFIFDPSHSKYHVCLILVFLYRNPVAQSTDACRGKLGYRRGRHAWEVMWEGPLGTVAVVGITTKDAPLQCPGYVALLGSNQHSWGWNLVENHLLHNGETRGTYPTLHNAKSYQVTNSYGLFFKYGKTNNLQFLKFQVGETIRVILDCENKTLSFERGCEFLGVAFKGLI